MSEEANEKVCKHPDRLKGKPGECSPEQVQECHGKDKEFLAKRRPTDH